MRPDVEGASAEAPATATEPRWLARQLLAEEDARWVDDLPNPQRLSHAWRAHDRLISEYALWWLAHPDPAGTFAMRTRWLHILPGRWRVRLLIALGYDGLLYLSDGKILGHVFYQRHGDALHAFSVAVDDEVASAGASIVMLLDYVALASRLAGIQRARVGRGINRVSRRLLASVKAHERDLGWRVDVDGGWLLFAP